MADDLTHLHDLALGVVNRAHGIELLDAKALGLEQFAGRALGEATGNDNVWLEYENILGLAGQLWIAARLRRGPGSRGIARIRTQTDDLLGIGERQQELVGTDINRSNARLG